jgi:hypothetical protein
MSLACRYRECGVHQDRGALISIVTSEYFEVSSSDLVTQVCFGVTSKGIIWSCNLARPTATAVGVGAIYGGEIAGDEMDPIDSFNVTFPYQLSFTVNMYICYLIPM